MTAAKELAGLILASTDSEATNTPFWGICLGNGNPTLLKGIWFDRISAEEELEAGRHNYGKHAYVYCFSGHASKQYQRVRELAEKINSNAEDPIKDVLTKAIYNMVVMADNIRRYDQAGADRLLYIADQCAKVMDENE